MFYFPQATIPDMMRYYRGIYPKFDAERYQKLGEVFQLDPKRQIRRLSKGMQKQAAFWLAMSLRPDVLILDEPVDGLDPVMRRQVWNLVLADVAENGTTEMCIRDRLLIAGAEGNAVLLGAQLLVEDGEAGVFLRIRSRHGLVDDHEMCIRDSYYSAQSAE